MDHIDKPQTTQRGIIFLILLLPFTHTLSPNNAHITENVIFLKKGQLQITQSKWDISLVIDVSSLNDLTNNFILKINKLQNLLKHPFVIGTETDHRNFQTEFQLEVDRINASKNRLENTLNEFKTLENKQRHKRAILNLGSAFSWLFGVASDDDVSKIKTGMTHLQDNQKILSHIIEKSLTIINSSHDEIETNRKGINAIIKSMKNIINKIETVHKKLYASNDYFIKYLRVRSFIEHTKLTLHELDNVFNHFKLQLESASTGKLTPALFPPSLLRTVLTEIQQKLPNNLYLPFNFRTNIFKYYQTLNLRVSIINHKLIIITSVPLARKENYFNIYTTLSIPIPKKINSTIKGESHTLTAEYDIKEQQFAINVDRSNYIKLSDFEATTCANRAATQCKLTKPIHQTATSSSCTMAIFLNKKPSIQKYCRKIVKQTNEFPTALYVSNGAYIIITLEDLTFSIVCQNGKQAYTKIIKPPVDFIQLEQLCTAISEKIILQPFFEENTNIETHSRIRFLPDFNMSQLNFWNSYDKKLGKHDNIQLPNELKPLQPIDINSLTDKLHNIHTYNNTYQPPMWLFSSLGMFILIILIFLTHKYNLVKKLKYKINTLRTNVKPTTENNTTPNIIETTHNHTNPYPQLNLSVNT